MGWVEAATFLSGRIQAPGGCEGRKADMSSNAAEMLNRALGEVEAACRITSNRETIVSDITNPASSGVGGGRLTQTTLKRVSTVHHASVDAMMGEMCNRLLGRRTSGPSNPGEAQVWADAALFFSNRIQASSGECPGRGADMSSYAAGAMRKVLPQIGNQAKAVKAANQEAAQMLMSNRERVVQDITNTSSVNMDAKHQASVDAMVNEVCCCLLGRATMKKPSLEDALVVWPQAATFLAGRIQGTASECPGRK